MTDKGHGTCPRRAGTELNHLFQTCKTGAPHEYGEIDQTMAPAALNIVTDWLQKHAR